MISFLICHIRTQYINPNQQIASDRELEWKQVREGGSEKLLDGETPLEVGGWAPGLTFEEREAFLRNTAGFFSSQPSRFC